MKITSELRSLSRFIGAQRTGFRKLLKKYKKWSNSDLLSTTFLPKLEESSDSFVNLDLSSKFVELSLLYDILRDGEFTTSIHRDKGSFLADLPKESLTKFDSEMVTSFTNTSKYWVHQDNFLELKVLLLQHLRLYGPDEDTRDDRGGSEREQQQRTFVIYLDDKKFHSIQSGIEPGQIRWVETSHDDQEQGDNRVLCSPTGGLRYFSSMTLDNQQTQDVIDGSIFQKPLQQDMDSNSKRALGWVQQRHAAPISKLSYRRTRFQSVEKETTDESSSPNNLEHPFIWAVLDNDIKITKDDFSSSEAAGDSVDPFPHAVLEIRWKGMNKPEWVRELEKACHLVKPMAEFSLYAHSVALLYPEALQEPPSWLRLVQKRIDIRKSPGDMPKLKSKRSNLESATTSTTQVNIPVGGENTILLNEQNSGNNNNLTVPPLDRHENTSDSNSALSSPTGVSPSQHKRPVIRYWNEFDDPEDGTMDDQGIFTVVNGEDEFENGFFSKEKVDQIVRISDKFVKGIGRIKDKLKFDNHNKRNKRYVRLLRDDNDNNSIVNNLEIDDDDDDDDNDDDDYNENHQIVGNYYNDDEHQQFYNRLSSSKGLGYDTFPGEEEGDEELYVSSSFIKRRDAVLTFLYTVCFFLSSLMTCVLLGVIAGEDMEAINTGTLIFIIAGLLFALAIGVLGMGLFLLRELPSWWHQTIVFSVFFSLVCFGVGAIAWLL